MWQPNKQSPKESILSLAVPENCAHLRLDLKNFSSTCCQRSHTLSDLPDPTKQETHTRSFALGFQDLDKSGGLAELWGPLVKNIFYKLKILLLFICSHNSFKCVSNNLLCSGPGLTRTGLQPFWLPLPHWVFLLENLSK